MHFDVTYENDSNFFTPKTASYEDKRVYFDWCGIEMYYPVAVDMEITGEHYYNKLNTYSTPKDIRGTYLLGSDYDNATLVMDLSQIPAGESNARALKVTSLGDEYESICDKNDLNEFITTVTSNVFKIVYDTDGYYAKVGSSFICKYTSNPDYTYYLLYLGTKENAVKVKIGLNGTLMTPDNDVFIYCHSYGSDGIYLNKNDHVGSNEDKMVLYKKEFSSDESTQLETYRASFFTNTSACRDDNTTVTENIGWSTLANSFNGLSADSQGYLGCLTYVHNGEAAESLNDMVDRYDYIVSKYGFNDFMNRGVANTLQNNVSSTNSVSLGINNSNIALVVTVIVVISSSTLFATLLFVKRKKHQ